MGTDQTGIGLIGVVNSTLQEILIETSSIVVRLNLAFHVVREDRPCANMLRRYVRHMSRQERTMLSSSRTET